MNGLVSGFSGLDMDTRDCIMQALTFGADSWEDLAMDEAVVTEMPEPEEETAFHVVAFIPGCLNDSDSGAIETLADASNALVELAESYYGDETWVDYEYADVDGETMPVRAMVKPHQYAQGGYVITIEPCSADWDGGY